ncbi:hypothetical protein GALMADRAFT_283979, partial [Galerina marginata CBS 339.88]
MAWLTWWSQGRLKPPEPPPVQASELESISDDSLDTIHHLQSIAVDIHAMTSVISPAILDQSTGNSELLNRIHEASGFVCRSVKSLPVHILRDLAGQVELYKMSVRNEVSITFANAASIFSILHDIHTSVDSGTFIPGRLTDFERRIDILLDTMNTIIRIHSSKNDIQPSTASSPSFFANSDHFVISGGEFVINQVADPSGGLDGAQLKRMEKILLVIAIEILFSSRSEQSTEFALLPDRGTPPKQ